MAFLNDLNEIYMLRCMQLANKGAGQVAPNPKVGCVIVKDEKVIGEGYHQAYGQAHAEVNAIHSVMDKSALEGSTFYVSLEPCHHYGNTPPCVDAVIKAKAKKVVIANTDPFDLVSGKSIAKLKAAGIEVVISVLEKKGRWLNRRFFTFVKEKRPYIILKWAQSQNGYIGRAGEQVWLTSDLTSRLTHQWRSEEAAILVGSRTVLADNPSLTVRHYKGKHPVRFYIDNQGQIPKGLNIHNDIAPSYCFTTQKVSNDNATLYIDRKLPYLPQVLKHLYDKKLNSLIVEGGRQLLQSFIDVGLWDEARILTANKTIQDSDNKGILAPVIPVKNLYLKDRYTLGTDEIAIFANPNRP